MEFGAYSKFKKAHNGKLSFLDEDTFAVSLPRFDPTTGERLSSQPELLRRSEIEAQKKLLQANLDACNELLADMDAAQKK